MTAVEITVSSKREKEISPAFKSFEMNRNSNAIIREREGERVGRQPETT
jgi:hypothetical protein